MTKAIQITIKVKIAWWVRPYIWLTTFGIWLGLPINSEVVARDLVRGVRLKVVK